MSREICPVCQNELRINRQPWHLVCNVCRYEKANLEPTINLDSAHQFIDESARATGLQAVRIDNFNTLLSRIRVQTQVKGKLLDVGCAHGWFLDVAKDEFDVLGLEPDQGIYDATASRGLPIRLGYFPDALNANEMFDVIVFNDVIEHIPDIQGVLDHCHEHLNKNGLLILNLPSSKGIFYRLSKIFCRLGFPGFFQRLWQKGLPSPHVHYFDHANLEKLLRNKGFEIRGRGNLPTIKLSGLYTRISYVGNYNIVSRLVIFSVVALSLPFLKILPSDIIYTISSKS